MPPPGAALPPTPFKTELGLDELRHRTRGLGQRHRTVLFIVDGRRPLSEVLSLAHQAGAATQHFEDLLRLGLVELTKLPEPPAPPPEPEPEVERESEPEPEQDLEPEAVPPREAGDVSPLPTAPPPTLTPVPVPTTRPVRPPRPPAPPEPTEAELVDAVRQLLLDARRHDRMTLRSPLPAQLRDATTLTQLVALAWQVDHELDATRRSREGRNCLERARELLGLGNTLVAEDTRPGGPG